MYLAFTMRSEGGNRLSQAAEILKDAIRTFPNVEPSHSEFGPENVAFYEKVRKQMDEAPLGRLRVHSGRETAGVYLNGRLVGVTPLDLPHVYPGRYRLHIRRSNEQTRSHEIEIKPGENDVKIDLGFDEALRTEGELAFAYANAADRRAHCLAHAVQLARAFDLNAVLVFWTERARVHLALVDAHGKVRENEVSPSDVMIAAVDLPSRPATEIMVGAQRSPRVWTWVVGGVAVGALATGIVLGLSANSDFDDLSRRFPDGNLPTSATGERDTAQTRQTTANVLVSVGAAAAIGTAVLYWYEGRVPSERAQLTPVIGPTFAGAQVRFAF